MLIFCQQNYALLAPKIDKWDLMTEEEKQLEEARTRVLHPSPESDSQGSQDLVVLEPEAGGSQASGPSQIPDTADAYPSIPKRAKKGKAGPKCSKK